MKKNLLNLLLCTAMAFCLFAGFSVTAEARASVICEKDGIYYSSIADALNADYTGEGEDNPTTITLVADDTESFTVAKERNITLDLNGHVLTKGGDYCVIANEGKLTIKDSNPKEAHFFDCPAGGTGKWTLNTTATSGTKVADIDSSTTLVEVDGGCITGGINNPNWYTGGGVANNGTLILESGNIVGNTGKSGGGVNCQNPRVTDKVFTMNGGTVIGNSSDWYGGGVYLQETTFTMNNGTIAYNTGYYGGGVESDYATFIMNNGTISHNSTPNEGGGVAIGINSGEGTFTMTGGTISNNTASKGGGVCSLNSDPYGYFKMTGGTISENTASEYGAGVSLEDGVGDVGDIILGGTAKIEDNVLNDKTLCNLKVPEGLMIALATDKEAPATGMNVGVTLSTADGYGEFVETGADETVKGYFSSDKGYDVICIDDNKDGNQELWLEPSYKITYETNGGENASKNPTSYLCKIGVAEADLLDATKEGYTFDGWYSDKDLTTKVTSISTTDTGDKTLYAKWTAKAKEYKITYELNGGTNAANSPATYTYGTGLATIPDATKEGYIFDGWYSDKDLTTKVTSISTTDTGDKTFYAKWTEKTEDSKTQATTPATKTKISATDALNIGLKVSQTGKQIDVTWGKVSGADGYMVYIAYCGTDFGKDIRTVKGAASIHMTIKKINGKKLNLTRNYKIFVKAYKNVNGKKKVLAKSITAHIVGRKNTTYTNVKSVNILSKTSLSLKVGKTSQIKAKNVLVNPKRSQLSNNHASEFRYASSNKKVARVSKTGKITATGKGSCTVYVYARNGYCKTIKVVVK